MDNVKTPKDCPVTERQIVNEKLLNLRQQKQDVSQCLDEILNIGRAWVVDHDQSAGSGFEKICHLLDRTSQLVANTFSEMEVVCDKEYFSIGKTAMTEAAVSTSETPERMEDSMLKQGCCSGLNGLTEHMKHISEQHKKTVTELDKRITDLEQSVYDLMKTLSGNKTGVCSEGKKKERHEDGKKREDDLCKLTMDVENMQEKFKELTTQTGRWGSLENSDKFNTLQEQVKNQDKERSALFCMENRLQGLLHNLPRKVTNNEEAIIDLLSQQKKGRNTLQTLEWEMENVQRNLKVTLKKCEQTSTDVEAMERRLEELLQSSASVVSLPETSSRKDRIGFAAKLRGELLLKKNKMTFIKKGNILNFTIIFNQGCDCDPAVGKFTVPRDGIYFICLTVHQYCDGQVVLHVTKQPNKCKKAESSCVFDHKYCLLEATTSEDLGRDCLFSFIEMKGGDDLYVTVAAVKDNPSLTDHTIFSCFLFS